VTDTAPVSGMNEATLFNLELTPGVALAQREFHLSALAIVDSFVKFKERVFIPKTIT